jgi:hypothetical protein
LQTPPGGLADRHPRKARLPWKAGFLVSGFMHGGRFADHFLINPAKWHRLIPEASD